MVKIRHISSLLVLMLLLLLVINCDLKSQREGIVQKILILEEFLLEREL